MKRPGWAIVLTLGATSAAAAPSGPIEPTPHGRTVFRTFGAAEGLHNLVVIGITQDAAGSLWVGTDDGLFRYDGERFDHFSVGEGLSSSSTLAVGVGPDGGVCAGSSNGLTCWDGTRFVPTDLPAIAVHAMVSHQGRLWVGTAAGLYVGTAAGGFTAAPGWPGAATTRVKALWADQDGLIVADGGELTVSAGDGVWQRRSGLGLAGDRIDGVLRDRDGALWIRSALHMWRLAKGATTVEDLDAGLAHGYDAADVASGMALGAYGEVWVGTDDGIAYRDGDRWRTIDRAAGFPGPSARTVFVDREGTTWIGAIGLFQWRGRSLLERHDPTTSLPGDVAWSFQRDRDGALWVGTNRCLARSVDGAWRCLPGTEQRVVRSFVFVPGGGVFVGGMPSDLIYIDAAGVVSSIVVDPRQQDGQPILALALGPEGDLWIGTKRGLYRLAGAVPGQPEYVRIPGVSEERSFSSLLVDDGRLWLATGDGIAVLDHGTWRLFDDTDGFRSSSLRYIIKSHDQRFCAAYREAIGVTCFQSDGRTVSAIEDLSVADGLRPGIVYFLLEDRQRRLWIGTGNGVDVLTRDGPRRGIEHFAERDGLAGDDAAATAAFEDRDGSLWLGSTGGATHVLAQRYDGPLPPPRVRFLGGRLGDRELDRGDGGRATTTHDRNALLLELGTDSLVDGNRIEYEVRLSPLERTWTLSHVRESRYPALPPDDYRFEVRARINSGAWGEPSELHFTVEPAWWQTRWFIVLAVVGGLGTLAAAVISTQRTILRRRTRHLERQLERQSELRFRALIESMPDLMGMLHDGKLVYLNRASRRLIGLGGAGDLSPDFSLHDYLHPDDVDPLQAMLVRAPDVDSSATPDNTLLRVRGVDGTWRTCELSAVQLEYHGRPAHVTCGRDVTERERAEVEKQDLHKRLVAASRQAGMAEVATNVLHNVGNVLNSVNISAALVRERLKKSKVTSLAKATALLRDHADDLVAYLTVDARGKLLPSYLQQLGDGLLEERRTLLEEVGSLTKDVDHIKRIVATQQSHAKLSSDVRELVDPRELVEDAARISSSAIASVPIELVREYAAIPAARLDRNKIVQILVNLINNAKQAMAPDAAAGRIRLVVGLDGDAAIQIDVIDNGIGIEPDNLVRIFHHGFTTRADGHGFGLHGAALSATEMGGTLTVHSDGAGRGARFCLRLPLEPAATAADTAAGTTLAA